MPEEKLKPCPFCGGEAHIIHYQYAGWCIDCLSCPVELYYMPAEDGSYWTKDETIKRWNTRPAEKLVPLNEHKIIEILGQVYTYKQHEHKILDAILMLDIAKQICARFASVPVVPSVMEIKDIILSYNLNGNDVPERLAQAIHAAIKERMKKNDNFTRN